MKIFKMTSKMWLMTVAATLVVMTSCKKELPLPAMFIDYTDDYC